jgi:hypothetical protein
MLSQETKTPTTLQSCMFTALEGNHDIWKSSSTFKSSTGAESSEMVEKPKPKRPLSAYNIFFKHERERMLADAPTRPQGKPRRSHGKIGFADLARSIASKWNSMDADTRARYNELAADDKRRYTREMAEWKDESNDYALSYANEMHSTKKDLDDMIEPISLDIFMAQSNNDVTPLFSRADNSLFRNSIDSRLFQLDDTEPFRLTVNSFRENKPTIDELAVQLDDECVRVIIQAFGK